MSPTVELVKQDQLAIASACLYGGVHMGRIGILHMVLCDILDGRPHSYYLVGIKVDGQYVGCTVYNRKTRIVMMFVKREYRRQGYGSQLLSGLTEALGLDPLNMRAAEGVAGAELFFEHHKIQSFQTSPLTLEEANVLLEETPSIRKLLKLKRKPPRTNLKHSGRPE